MLTNRAVTQKYLQCLMLIIVLSALLSHSKVHAEIVLDGSTGSTGALVGPQFQVTEAMGLRQGTNLLHSFSQFNLSTSETATFSGDSAIVNIISRVTGGTPSSIDGLVHSTIPGANFFFINPSGIVIGPHAVIDVSGALHLSTASQLLFNDGQSLTTVSAGTATLTMASPAAFGFLENSQGSIQLQGTNLNIATDQFIGLNAGTINLHNADITAPGGTVSIATTLQPAEVTIQSGGYHMSASTRSGEIHIGQGSDIRAAGGTIRIQGGAMTLDQGQLNVSNESNVDGGRVSIDLSGDLSIMGGGSGQADAGRIRAHVSNAGSSEGIDIHTGGDIRLENRALVGSIVLEPFTSGNAGDLVLQADGNIVISDSTVTTRTEGLGQAGNILIQSGIDLLIIDTSRIDSSSRGIGINADAGQLVLRARDTLLRDSVIDTGGRNSRNGDADIHVNTLTLESSFIDFSSNDAVPGGDLTLIADHSVILRSSDRPNSRRSFIGTSSNASTLIQTAHLELNNATLSWSDSGLLTSMPGSFAIVADSIVLDNGGNIRLNYTGEHGTAFIAATQSILLSSTYNANRNDNSIETDTGSIFAAGNGASLTLSTPQLTLQGDSASLVTNGGSHSTAGNILIDAGILTLRDGAHIESSQARSRNDGQIIIHASESVNLLSNGTVDVDDNLPVSYIGVPRGDSFITSNPGSSGNISITAPVLLLDGGQLNASNTALNSTPGTININTDTLLVRNGSRIASFNRDSTLAGDIHIQVSQSVEVSGADSNGIVSLISTLGIGEGNGGNLSITSDRLLLDGGRLSTSTAGITPDTGESNDSVNATSGSLSINVRTLSVLNGAQISSSVTDAQGGQITVNASEHLLIDGERLSMTDDFIVRSGIVSGNLPGGSGNAGLVSIMTPELQVQNRGFIATQAQGDGNGGDIVISAGQVDLMTGAVVSSSALGAGNGGSITISADHAYLDSALIAVSSDNLGDAGNISLQLTNELRLGNASSIRAQSVVDNALTQATLNGGDITIAVGDLLLLDRSAISTLTNAATGNGGNIFIDPVFIVLNQSVIVANAQGGNGGNIDLISDFIFISDTLISASSALGIDGQIQVAAPDINLSNQLALPTANFLDESDQLRQSCIRYKREDSSTFRVINRTAMHALPDTWIH